MQLYLPKDLKHEHVFAVGIGSWTFLKEHQQKLQ